MRASKPRRGDLNVPPARRQPVARIDRRAASVGMAVGFTMMVGIVISIGVILPIHTIGDFATGEPVADVISGAEVFLTS